MSQIYDDRKPPCPMKIIRGSGSEINVGCCDPFELVPTPNLVKGYDIVAIVYHACHAAKNRISAASDGEVAQAACASCFMLSSFVNPIHLGCRKQPVVIKVTPEDKCYEPLSILTIIVELERYFENWVEAIVALKQHETTD